MESCNAWPLCRFLGVMHIAACTSAPIRSSVDEYLCCFSFLAIMSNSALHVCVQASMCTYVFNSLGVKLPRSHCNSTFTFLRSYQTVFRSSCTVSYSYRQGHVPNNACYCLCFWLEPGQGCAELSHVVLFSGHKRCWASCIRLLALCIFFREIFVRILCLFFIGLFIAKLQQFFIYSWFKSLSR